MADTVKLTEPQPMPTIQLPSSHIPEIQTQKAASGPPYDLAELGGRNCSTCACYFQMTNTEEPHKVQAFCRRSPADLTEVRSQEQRRDNTGRPVFKDGRPVMQPATVTGFLFKAALPEGVCFDGWRPKGTLPGEIRSEYHMRQSAPQIVPLLEKVPPELQVVLRALLPPLPEARTIDTGTTN